MAREGKSLAQRMSNLHDELLEGIADHAQQVYGHLPTHEHVVDPSPADFVTAGLCLKVAREINGEPALPRDVVVGTFLWLVPEHER